MIEAPEYATPTQLRLYHHYRDIHRRFFPSHPPLVPKQESQAASAVPVVAAPPPPKPPPAKAIPFEATHLRLRMILRAICEFYHVTELDLKSQRRTRNIVVPRHMFSYLASKFTKASTPTMGRLLGGQDHTTVMHAIRGMQVRVRTDRTLAAAAQQLEAALRQQFVETTTPRNCIGCYVVHERVESYFRCGWMWAANLNEYAALMVWVCGCECVEPRG